MTDKQETAVTEQAERNYRKTRQGYVVSDKMDKTVVVEVEDRVKHALYGKVMRRSSKVKAHDENNSAGIGDRVLIMETRPLSATKRWRVVEILERAKSAARHARSREVHARHRWGGDLVVAPPARGTLPVFACADRCETIKRSARLAQIGREPVRRQE